MGASILIVDASTVSRRQTVQLLQCEGYEVTAAADGIEALTRLDLHPVDLVVTELLLPALNGVELLQRLQAADRPTPVILLSRRSDDQAVIEAFRAGARDYVCRDAAARELPAAIERVLSAVLDERERREPEDWIVSNRVTLDVASNRLHVCPLVRWICRQALQSGVIHEQDEIRVAVALEEALLNAIIHGNLEVSSSLREEDGSLFESMIAQRQADPRFGRRRVRVECDITAHELRCCITDEGPGFNVHALPDPRDEDRISLASGRGILMMRAFMDEVIFNRRGNQVTLIRRRAPAVNDPPAARTHGCESAEAACAC